MKTKCNSMPLAALPANPPIPNPCQKKGTMKTRVWKILATTNLLALAMFGSTQSAIAATPAYLNGMPSVERVPSEVHGTNAPDTAARQLGVFDQLISMMGILEGPRQFQPSPEELSLRMTYVSAENKIVASVQQQLRNQKTSATGMNTPWAKWTNARWAYSEDTAYVLNQFFSPQWQSEDRPAALREKQVTEVDRKAAFANISKGSQNSDTGYHGLGGITQLVLLGILLIFAIPLAILLSRLRIDRNATRFTAGLRRWNLTNITGHVISYRSHTETSGGGGYSSGNTTVPVHIKTDLYENLRLKLSNGKLWDTQLGNFDFSPQIGDVITVCLASRGGAQRIFAALNHTTESGKVNRQEIFAIGTGGSFAQILKVLAMTFFMFICLVIGMFVQLGVLVALGFIPFGIWLLRTLSIKRLGIKALWDATAADAQVLMSPSPSQ